MEEKTSSENKWPDAREYNGYAEITNAIDNLSHVMDQFRSETGKTKEKSVQSNTIHGVALK